MDSPAEMSVRCQGEGCENKTFMDPQPDGRLLCYDCYSKEAPRPEDTGPDKVVVDMSQIPEDVLSEVKEDLKALSREELVGLIILLLRDKLELQARSRLLRRNLERAKRT